MKDIDKACAIIIYGDANIFIQISNILEQIAEAGIKRFLVAHKKPFNRHATFSCLLLKNKYKDIIIETYDILNEFNFGFLINKTIHKGRRTKSQDYISNCELYKILIKNSDIVILQKNSIETENAVEYAKANNKQVVFLY